MQDDDRVYAVVNLYRGYAEVALAEGLATAMKGFCMEACLVADLFPSEHLEVHGQDDDDGLPYLALSVNGRVLLTLQQPAKFVHPTGPELGEGMAAGEGSLPGVDEAETFAGAAAWFNFAFQEEDGAQAQARKERALNSWPAMHLTRDYHEILAEVGKETAAECPDSAPKGDPSAIREALGRVRLPLSMTTTLR